MGRTLLAPDGKPLHDEGDSAKESGFRKAGAFLSRYLTVSVALLVTLALVLSFATSNCEIADVERDFHAVTTAMQQNHIGSAAAPSRLQIYLRDLQAECNKLANL